MTRPGAYAILVPSGQAWLGDVPEHWDLAPLGTHFDERKETVSDRDFQPLSVTKQGVIPQMTTAAKTDNGDSRKLVRAGDFAINARSDRKGSAGVSDLDGSVSVVYTILEPRPTVFGRFVHHLMRSSAFGEEYYRWGNGIVDDLWSTRFSAMKRIVLALPPLPEQRAIADYLDRETAQIDALIGKQELLIGTLRERRVAVVSLAIDRSDDLTALRRHLIALRQGWSPNCEVEPADGVETWGVLKTGAPNRGVFSPHENKRLPDAETPRPETVVRRDEIVMSRASSREWVGSAAKVNGDYPRLMLSDLTYGLHLSSGAHPDYVVWALGSRRARGLIEAAAKGTSPSMQKLSQRDIRELLLWFPPLNEQRRIVEYLDEQTVKIDALIAKAERFIEVSKERRSALITAAVTGQIDVRGRGGAETVRVPA